MELSHTAQAQLLADITTVTNAIQWNGNQRTILTTLILDNPRTNENGDRIIYGLSAARIIERTGIGEKTVEEMLAAMELTDLLTRKVDKRTPMHKKREIEWKEYAAGKKGKTASAFWINTEMVYTILPLPTKLKDLPDSANVKLERQKRKKEKAQTVAMRKQLDRYEKAIQRKLDGKPCPECGEGHLHVHITATCDTCGTIFDSAQIEAAVTGKDNYATQKPHKLEPYDPKTAKFADVAPTSANTTEISLPLSALFADVGCGSTEGGR